MKIRIGFAGGGVAGAPLDASGFALLVDCLEKLGFDSLWLSERICAETWDSAAALAFATGRTRRLKLGTSVMVLPGRNPVLLAKQLASIDRLSEGLSFRPSGSASSTSPNSKLSACQGPNAPPGSRRRCPFFGGS